MLFWNIVAFLLRYISTINSGYVSAIIVFKVFVIKNFLINTIFIVTNLLCDRFTLRLIVCSAKFFFNCCALNVTRNIKIDDKKIMKSLKLKPKMLIIRRHRSDKFLI